MGIINWGLAFGVNFDNCCETIMEEQMRYLPDG
jgi:hypothetical protein